MNEIEKLRQRLKNVGKNVTEYRMTVTEAKALINEIDALHKSKQELQIEVVNETAVTTRIIDGGAF